MSSSLPWSIRRHLPCYPENYHQTRFDHGMTHTDPALVSQLLAQGSLKYDHANLKGDGTPNLTGVLRGTKRRGWGRDVGDDERLLGLGREISFGSFGDEEDMVRRSGRPDWGSRSRGGGFVLGGGGPKRYSSPGRPGSPLGSNRRRPPLPPPVPKPPPDFSGIHLPPRSQHSESQGRRPSSAVPGSRRSQHSGPPPAPSSRHTTPSSPAPGGNQHSRPPPAPSSHHTTPGSPAPGGSQHSGPPPAPSSRHTTPGSHRSNPPSSGAGPRAPSSHHTAPGSHRSNPPPSRGGSGAPSSHHTAPGSHRSNPPPSRGGSGAPSRDQSSCPPPGSSRRSEPGSHHSTLPPPPHSTAAESRSQRSRAGSGSGSGMPSRGSGLGSVQVNSKGMTWRDV